MSFMHTWTTAETQGGIRVANFSSPHEFRFDDGTKLPSVSEARCRELSLHCEEMERPGRVPGTTDVVLRYTVTPAVSRAIEEACRQAEQGLVDIFLIPRPVKYVFHRPGHNDLRGTPFRACVFVDEIKALVSATKFAV